MALNQKEISYKIEDRESFIDYLTELLNKDICYSGLNKVASFSFLFCAQDDEHIDSSDLIESLKYKIFYKTYMGESRTYMLNAYREHVYMDYYETKYENTCNYKHCINNLIELYDEIISTYNVVDCITFRIY